MLVKSKMFFNFSYLTGDPHYSVSK